MSIWLWFNVRGGDEAIIKLIYTTKEKLFCELLFTFPIDLYYERLLHTI